jgi:SET domain-containing protein
MRRKPRAKRRPPHDGVYARIGPSRIHGVGVLAIRDIPAGTRLFRGEEERVAWVRWDVVRRLPRHLRQLYVDFGMLWDDSFGVPRTFNMLSVGWYLNHSERPNVVAGDDGRFRTLRRIRKGEELTADYRTFADSPLPFAPIARRRGIRASKRPRA